MNNPVVSAPLICETCRIDIDSIWEYNYAVNKGSLNMGRTEREI